MLYRPQIAEVSLPSRYVLGRIPANGIIKLSYYNDDVKEEAWMIRGKSAHLHTQLPGLFFLNGCRPGLDGIRRDAPVHVDQN